VIQTVLVPLDGSSCGDAVLPLAQEIARSVGASLHLVHVHDATRYAGHLEALAGLALDWPDHVRERMVAELEVRAAAIAAATDVSCVTRVFDGRVARKVQEYAAEIGADLIVMGTHGLGGLSRSWLGSVADSMVRTSPVPILLVRSGETVVAGLPRHILLPIEEGFAEESVLRWVQEIGVAAGTRCTLVRVLSPVAIARPIMASVPVVDERALEGESQRAGEHLEMLADRLRAVGMDVTTIASARGSVPRAILECAAQHSVELIVMATHGRGGMARLALGSVTDKVIRGATVPVLVVPRARES
jgi:nucleotide-binding universal stress UspA family protein